MSRAQFRILMLLTVVSGLVGGAVVSCLLAKTAAFAPQTSAEVVTAQGFRLVDERSNTRAWLGCREDGSVDLSLYDTAGDVRAWLVCREDGGVDLSLCDAAGNARTTLRVREDGRPSLSLCDAACNARAWLKLLKDGAPSLSLRDVTGKVIWETP